jgi:drug/metabolite transporter (DMT)-like permease
MKKHKLIGIALASAGIIVIVAGDTGSTERMIGMMTTIIGFGWFIVGRSHD